MNWVYYVVGAALLGGYALIYYMRIQRMKRIEEYERSLSLHVDDAKGEPSETVTITREMVQSSTDKDGNE